MNATALVEHVGVEKERVDPYTLQIVDALFPGKHGVAFLAAILRHAQVKQLALPEIGLDVTDVAVITVQSLRVLARLIGLSYDTTEKYVVVWHKLRLLHKKRKRSQITLHFPLCSLSLPSPELLEDLDYRPKVLSFAARVKERMVSLRKMRSESTFLPEAIVPREQRASIATLLSDIQNLLSEEVDSHAAGRLLPKIERAIRGRLFPQKVDSDFGLDSSLSKQSTFLSKGDSHAFLLTGQNLLSDQKGDFYEGTQREGRSESPFQTAKGDSNDQGEAGQSLLSSQKGDSDQEGFPAQIRESPFENQKGDFYEGSIDGKSRFFLPKGDSFLKSESESTFESQKGNFQGADIPKNVNDNDITLLFNDLRRENDSVNVHGDQSRLLEATHSKKEAGIVGRSLADFLDKGQNIGGYVEKCKKATPTQVRAAVIASLVHTHFPGVNPHNDKGRPKIKGAWFHDFCNQYIAGEPIPAYVRKWLSMGLPWKEIDEVLLAARARYTRYLYADERSAHQVRRWLWGEIEQDELEKVLGITGDLACQEAESLAPVVPVPVAKDWMDQSEAEALADEILRDGGLYGVTKTSVKPHSSGGAYLVLLLWGGVPMTMASRQQWRTHFADVLPEFQARAKAKEGRT